MFLSHRFESVETLNRAQFWLTHHGFEVVATDDPRHDASRLILSVPFSKMPAALAIIESIDHLDVEDSMTEDSAFAMLARSTEVATCANGHRDRKACTPICWHPREEDAPADAGSSKISEYMFSRWE